MRLWLLAAGCGVLLCPAQASAQPIDSWLGVLESSGLTWAVLVLVFLSCTSFLKLSIVLSSLRGGIGIEGAPSAGVVTALSVALTMFIMAPVAAEMADLAQQTPTASGSTSPLTWSEPLLGFMSRNTRTAEAQLLERLESDRSAGSSPTDADEALRASFTATVPAFMLTELSEAFQIVLLLLLPFMVIDLVVASMITSLGLQALRVASVAIPMKVLLFLVVDGWALLAESLIHGYI